MQAARAPARAPHSSQAPYAITERRPSHPAAAARAACRGHREPQGDPCSPADPRNPASVHAALYRPRSFRDRLVLSWVSLLGVGGNSCSYSLPSLKNNLVLFLDEDYFI